VLEIQEVFLIPWEGCGVKEGNVNALNGRESHFILGAGVLRTTWSGCFVFWIL
jgi:hypothetical protein